MNKLDKIVVLGAAGVAVLVAGIAFAVTGIQYAQYSKKYDAEAKELENKFARAPEEVFMDDEYVTFNGTNVADTKSAHGDNVVVLNARAAKVAPLSDTTAQTYVPTNDDFEDAISGLNRKGGAISFTIEAENHSLGDIEIAFMTNWVDENGTYHGLENITDYIKIQINKLDVKTEECELSDSREEWSHLILKDTNLIEGQNTLTITTSAYNSFGNKDDILYVMPDIRNVTFMADVGIEAVLAEADE